MKGIGEWFQHNIFEIVTTILAVVAIVFASIQYGDSRKQLRQGAEQLQQSSAQLDKLKDITSSIQTSYVGDFPRNMDEITTVVEKVSDGGELDIMADFAGYGIYSRNDAFMAYEQTLVSKHQQKSVAVKMLVYDKSLAEKALRTQFKPKDYDEEKAKGFRGFFKRHPPEPADYDGFIARVLEFQDEEIHHMCRDGIEIRRVPPSQKYLFFLWGSNNPQAVFAFRNEATKNREISFRTVDRSLIEVFKTVFDNTWRDADASAHKEVERAEDKACRDVRLSLTAR
jgi:hypothetical protein